MSFSRLERLLDNIVVAENEAAEATLQCDLGEALYSRREVTDKRLGGIGKLHWTYLINPSCGREWQLVRKYGLSTVDVERPADTTHIMWEVGRAVEKYVRVQLIAYYGRDAIFGDWACKCGREVVRNERKFCSVCDTYTDRYREIDVGTEYIVAHPDLLLRLGDKLVVVEIKSMVGSQFSMLLDSNVPGNYRIQSMGYSRFASRLFPDVSSESILLVVNKDFSAADIYKQFILTPGTAEINTISYLEEVARSMTEQEMLLPKDKRCAELGILAPKARNCSACNVCFSEDG